MGSIMDWRRTMTNLVAFMPRVDGPLVVELVEYLRNHEDIVMSINFGVWDFVSSGSDDDEPVLAVKSVRNSIPRDLFSALSRSRIPLKVILVEGQNPDIEKIMAQSMLLSSTGTGVYVRNYGWVTLPSRKINVDLRESAFIKSKKWRLDDDGEWRKRCRKCGEWKEPEGYSSSGRSVGHDPYRSTCKACDNKARTERNRAKARGA